MKVQANDSLALLVKVTNGYVVVLSKLLRQLSAAKALRIATVFRRLAPRRGKNKAILAVAHRLLRAAYHILLKREPYKDLGANYLDKQDKEHLLTRLCRNIKQLGYPVTLQLSSEPAS